MPERSTPLNGQVMPTVWGDCLPTGSWGIWQEKYPGGEMHEQLRG
ncbi:hypothetical protein [Shewanella sp. NFH-SH190041]|nr:hypothetical protein [Shewanella sp. NFH-SH190041]